MKLTVVKTLMRVVGTAAGLLGIFMLCITPAFLPAALSEPNPLVLPFAIFQLLLGVYFLYVAYLVWFRLSPLAVKHVCGMLAFFLFALIARLVDVPHEACVWWPAVASFAGLGFAFWVYQAASRRLSRLLFPQDSSGVPS